MTTVLVKRILDSMSNLHKPQKIFITLFFSTLITFRGKATFRNLSRYSTMSERRFSRWYRREFDFTTFNSRLITQTKRPHCIAAIDASFMKKSGKKTDGLGYFYNGGASKAERGLELSLVSIIDLDRNTGYALNAKQTIDVAVDEKQSKKKIKGETRVDLYAQQVVELAPELISMGIEHLAMDSYYSKTKFVTAVVNSGLNVIGKLRHDANLKWLYTDKYSGRGRPKKYDGKVFFDDIENKLKFISELEDESNIYSGIVYSVNLKCMIRLVVLKHRGKHALFFSTDINLEALTIIKYYKSRFQIEFIFRDAKQYTGLMDCQSRDKKCIETHINASLTALNLLKFEDEKSKGINGESVISIASWKRKKFNQHLMKIFFERLKLDLSDKKIMKVYDELSEYGLIAA